MRNAAWAVAALFVGMASATPQNAVELRLPLGGVEAPAPANPVPQVERGRYVSVTCSDIERMATENIRVVMYLLTDKPPAGMVSVLATDQTITPGTIHVRVPEMTELADRMVFVRVYYVDASGRHICDGGKIRII